MSNDEYRISNIEGMNSVDSNKKRMSEAKPAFDILRFDIRYSTVRFLIFTLTYGVLSE
jgi:hypothetical protein